MNTDGEIYFTADLHFGHKNVIGFCDRPYEDVDEMDEALIANWNARVTHQDTVYILGDVSFHKRAKTREILSRLVGTIRLIRGNHDKSLKGSDLDRFEWVKDLYNLKILDDDARGGVQRIVLCHYAMKVWEKSHRGAWQLYGHSHGSIPDNPNAFQMDVGVDSNDYRPISYREVKAKMAAKEWKPSDYHGTV